MSLNFSPKPRRARSESIVPMINVVFLLLIFFLMTSQLVPPEPFEVTPPAAALEVEATPAPVLYLSGGGQLGFGDARGEAALAAFVSAVKQAGEGQVAQLRADKAVPAARVATLMRDLAAAGLSRAQLVVEGR
ncbi:biopolymer transporter ExbD [Vannielia sp.]|uniref:ExbD/TolR family protein n=1 Tax=Vannielia sp. TaxID=2813045 RepID=UPI002621D669|nr:biopolymer transporter ExbD [Vannielia sp.]MDF1871586.1 biopolymer transporter ExbD [Vannielia sp.]